MNKIKIISTILKSHKMAFSILVVIKLTGPHTLEMEMLIKKRRMLR